MMMAMLAAGGIPPLTDNIRAPDQNNPKGYYEFERVKRLPEGDTAWLAEARGRAVKVISALLTHLPPEYHYRVIFMHRHLAEVLASQRAMLASQGHAVDEAEDTMLAAAFKRHLAQVEAWLAQQPNMQVLHVHYNELLRNPETQLARIDDFLGGQLNVQAMSSVIDRALYRQRMPETL